MELCKSGVLEFWSSPDMELCNSGVLESGVLGFWKSGGLDFWKRSWVGEHIIYVYIYVGS